MRSCRHLLLVVFVFVVASAPCLADQVVYFLNGKAIVVKSIEKGPKFTVLEIEGGGRMGVPTDQISRIEEYVIAQPAAPVPPPQVVVAPPVIPQAQPAVATAPGGVVAPPAVAAAQQAGGQAAPPPVMPSVPGPGMGGRPAGGARNLAGLTPIGIGGDGSVPMPTMRNMPEPRRGMAGGQVQGPPGSRQNFMAQRRNGRPGMGGGGGRSFGGPADVSRPVGPPGQRAESTQPPRPSTAPPPAAPAPQATSPQADDPPAAEEPDHDDSSEQPAAPPEDENQTSDDSSGSSK